MDRLEEIKEEWEDEYADHDFDGTNRDVQWLIAEVERLREELQLLPTRQTLIDALGRAKTKSISLNAEWETIFRDLDRKEGGGGTLYLAAKEIKSLKLRLTASEKEVAELIQKNAECVTRIRKLEAGNAELRNGTILKASIDKMQQLAKENSKLQKRVEELEVKLHCRGDDD